MLEQVQVARDYLVGRDDFVPIDRAELRKRVRAGTVALIDVRPAGEYEQGHIAGAVFVPLDDLPRWTRTAPKQRQVAA